MTEQSTQGRMDHEELARSLAEVVDLVKGMAADNVIIKERVEGFTAIQPSLEEMIEIFTASKGAIKVGGWLYKLAKWLAAVGAAIALSFAAFKGVQK